MTQLVHLGDVLSDAELVRRTLAAAGVCREIAWAQDETISSDSARCPCPQGQPVSLAG